MKQLKYTLLVCILSMLNLSETRAQGLSLSFNLSETDTLANMIAESKKNDITELTLSGVINIPNADYIIDLNNKGSLQKIDLSNVTALHGATIKRIRVYGKEGEKVLSYYESPETWMYKIIKDYLGWDGTTSSNHQYHATIEVIDILNNNGFTRQFIVDYGNYGCWKGTKKMGYSDKWPKDVFCNCSFDKFVMPNNLITVGGTDRSFCPQYANTIVFGEKIQKIDNYAFKGAYLGRIEFTSNISTIGNGAFEGARGGLLTKNFFDNLTSIGNSAFKDSYLVPNNLSLLCIKELGEKAFMNTLAENVEIGDELLFVSNETFADCINLQRFRSGANIRKIGIGAFSGCKKLKEIQLPNGLSYIGNYAFADNTSLVKFSVPDAVRTIGFKAFGNSGLYELNVGNLENFRRDIVDGCDSLKVITVSNSNENLISIDGVLYSKDQTQLLLYPMAKDGDIYEIDNNVTEIADSAFYGARELRAVSVGETVKKVGKNAFNGSGVSELKMLPKTMPKVTDNNSGLNQSITRLFVPESSYSNYYIANYWGDFKQIYSLDKAVSADGVINVEVAGTLPAYIGFGNQYKYNALRISGHLNDADMRYLSEMSTLGVLTDLDFSLATLEGGIISKSIFEGSNLTKLAISESVTKIGERAFYDCDLQEFIIPKQVTEIGNLALKGAKLSSINIPASTIKFDIQSLCGMRTLKQIEVDADNQQYMSSDGVLFTKDGKTLLLYPNGKEGDSYTTPASVVYIGEYAFGGYKLKKVTLNEGVKEIGDYAFDLEFLESVGLPSTLELLGHRAFFSCNQLMDILCLAITPPTIRYDPYAYYGQPYNNFSDKTYSNASLMVPEGSSLYKTRKGWSLFNHILEMDFSDVESIQDNISPVAKTYDISGRENKNLRSGLNIIRGKSGVYKKVMIK